MRENTEYSKLAAVCRGDDRFNHVLALPSLAGKGKPEALKSGANRFPMYLFASFLNGSVGERPWLAGLRTRIGLAHRISIH